MHAYDRLLAGTREGVLPESPFWRLAFHENTLSILCRMRRALQRSLAEHGNREADAVALLRAVMLGGQHGPLKADKSPGSYFSNQMLRTFAPKPDYAVRFWNKKRMKPQEANVRDIVRHRAALILRHFVPPQSSGHILVGDSRKTETWSSLERKISKVVTSPPYYGMVTYEADQWLRLWFLGGPSEVRYRNKRQLSHHSPDDFTRSMTQVWDRIAEHARDDISMWIRFGAIGSRKSDCEEILKTSLRNSASHWRVCATRDAGDSGEGRRQSLSMGKKAKSSSIEERDFYVRLA